MGSTADWRWQNNLSVNVKIEKYKLPNLKIREKNNLRKIKL